MTNFYEQLLRGTMPELVLTVTAFAVLGVDLFHEKGGRLGRWRLSGVLALLGIAVAVLLLPGLRGWSGGLGDVWVLDGAALLVKGAIFILLAGVVWLSLLWRDAVHVGEHYLLLLLAGVGLSVMVSSANLVVLFVGLELASLSGYLLVGLGPLGGRS